MLNAQNIRLGIAPIAWTNDDMPDLGKENSFEQCISEAALAGYAGTEIGNKYPRDPAVLKKYLDIRNLTVASAWFSAFLTTKPFEETAGAFKKHRDFLHAMGARVIVVSEQGHSIQGEQNTPIFEKKYCMNDAEWKTLCEGLNKLGMLAKEKDMRVVYHHHMGTVVQTTAEIDRMMTETDPSLVYLLYDTGHLVYSGEDHMRVLKKYSERIKHVHLKDIRPALVKKVKNEHLSFLQGVRLGTFTVPGDGSIDFDTVFEVLAAHNYKGWLLVEAEQDPALANPFEYALKARHFIREHAGV